jgi:hypothetical protein
VACWKVLLSGMCLKAAEETNKMSINIADIPARGTNREPPEWKSTALPLYQSTAY